MAQRIYLEHNTAPVGINDWGHFYLVKRDETETGENGLTIRGEPSTLITDLLTVTALLSNTKDEYQAGDTKITRSSLDITTKVLQGGVYTNVEQAWAAMTNFANKLNDIYNYDLPNPFTTEEHVANSNSVILSTLNQAGVDIRDLNIVNRNQYEYGFPGVNDDSATLLGTNGSNEIIASEAHTSGLHILGRKDVDDFMIGTRYDDHFYGSQGGNISDNNDVVSYEESNAGVFVDLSASGIFGSGKGGHAEGDSYNNIEHFYGSNFADTFKFSSNTLGSSFDNYINAGNGYDNIDSGDGDDTIIGGIGIDTIKAGDGDDYIDAGVESNIIDAGDGDDTIISTGGNIVAGDGNDVALLGVKDTLFDGGEGEDSVIFDKKIIDFKITRFGDDVLFKSRDNENDKILFKDTENIFLNKPTGAFTGNASESLKVDSIDISNDLIIGSELQVIFLVDVSGSMEGKISNTNLVVGKAIDVFHDVSYSTEYALATFNTAQDNPYSVAVQATTDGYAIQNAVSGLVPDGGGEEAIFGAINSATFGAGTGFSAEYANRVIVVISDEAPSNSGFTSTIISNMQSLNVIPIFVTEQSNSGLNSIVNGVGKGGLYTTFNAASEQIGNLVDSMTGEQDLTRPQIITPFEPERIPFDASSGNGNGNTGGGTGSGGGNSAGFTTNPDSYTGDNTDETLLALGGNDTVLGQGGSDTIDGGAGNDYIEGNAGNDSIALGSGYDGALGGDGDDTISGQGEADVIFGEAGNDLLYGDAGDDSVVGQDGNDSVYGGSGNDVLQGNAGNDALLGGFGDDTIYAHNGIDFANGNQGNDEIHLGYDGDTGKGGSGNDSIYGFDGDDSINGEAGDDFLGGGNGNDTLQGEAGADGILAGSGEDELNGGIGNDTLHGQGGADTVFAGDGDDEITGGTGNDSLDGESGSDIIAGNSGADAIFGGNGDDQLYGQDGNDWIFGGQGLDYMAGGAGDDKFIFRASDNDNSNKDRIGDFNTNEDAIRFVGYGDMNVNDLNIFQSGTNLKITNAADFGTKEIVLFNLDASDINDIDFEFV